MKKGIQSPLWFRQIRGPFLILSVVLVGIGIAGAYADGFIHWGNSLLILVGVLLAHISVNLFNELSDYQSGIDSQTKKTGFSGGSGLLQKGKTRPESVRIAAYLTMLGAGLVGFYFYLISGWLILGFMIIGGLAIRFYTTHFTRYLVGELISGISLGTFVVLGVYYGLAKTLTVEMILISIPPGILTALLLFLNEFPDREADQKGGRHHLVIHFGRKKSSRFYIMGLLLVYLWIGFIPWIGGVPYGIFLSFLTLPLTLKAGAIVLKHYNQFESMLPALGLNVGIVILTDFFLAIGLLF